MFAPLPSDRQLLDRTGRSFAVTVRLLPAGLRGPVEIAYLLARAADTIADRDLLNPGDRARALALIRGALERDASITNDLEPLLAQDAAPGSATEQAEAALLASLDRLLVRYRRLPGLYRYDVAEVVATLVHTMEHELHVLGGGTAADPAALPDAEALDAYTDGIAGCVGSFWTALVVRRDEDALGLRRPLLDRLGRRYGRGLQLVNVLRDLPRDVRRGRCFLPADELAAAGLRPADLLNPSVLPRLAPILARWERRAAARLEAGLVYTAALPARAWRLRLATALPARIGLLTLERLAGHPARLDPHESVKVSRAQLRSAIGATAFWSLFPRGPLRLM